MRIFTSGRGCPPPVDADCIHCWVFDKSSGTATVQDLKANSYDLSTIGGTPTTVTNSSVGKYARVHAAASTQHTAGAANAVDAAVTSRTIVGAFRLDSGSTGSAPVMCYEGAGSPSTMFALYYTLATRKLRIRWQDSGGSSVDTDSDVALPYGKWIHFAVTLSVAGTTTVKLFLWGAKEKEATGKANPRTTAASQRWVFGGNGALSGGENVTWACCAVYNVAKSEEWVENTLRDMLLLNGDTYTPVKVEIANNAGSLVDVSTAFPVDFLNSVSVKDDVDQNVASATINLWREQGGYSLAKYHDNPINRTPLPSSSAIGPASQTYTAPGSGTSAEALAIDRTVRVSTCRLPLGVVPVAADWGKVFEGYIDDVDWGGEGDTVTVECRDLGARIQDAHIMTDEVYGSDAGTAVQTVSQTILDDAASVAKSPRWGLQTAWPRTTTAPTLLVGWDGQVCQPAADPVWNNYKWAQSRMPVLQALNVLWEQIGFKCRYKWVPSLEDFRLVAYEPTRLRFDKEIVLTEDDVLRLSALKVSKASIRTLVRVSYASNEGSTPAVPSIATGTTSQAVGTAFWEAPSSETQSGSTTIAADLWGRAGITVLSTDLHSSEAGYGAVAEYGIIPCEIAEPAGSNINTIAEAQRLAVAVLRDLCSPKAEVALELRCLPELEVGDYSRLRANDRWSTSDFDLAVVSIEKRWTPDGDTTTITARGTPSGGHHTHLQKEARPGVAAPPSITTANADRDLPPRVRRGMLRSLQKNTGFWRESTKVAIRNGDFSHRNFGSNPPDCWRMNAGTWVTDVDVDTSTVDRGVQSVKVKNNTGKIETDDYIPVNSATTLQVEARVRVSAASINAKVEVEWFDSAKASISSSTVFDWTPTATGTWYTKRDVAVAPANARYYRVRCSRTGGGAGDCFFNWVQSTPIKPAFWAYVNTTYTLTDKAAPSEVRYDSEYFDHGGHFTPYTGAGTCMFTCPEDGWYEFSAGLHVNAASGNQGLQLVLQINPVGGGAFSAIVDGTPSSQGNHYSGTTHGSATLLSGPRWLVRGDRVRVAAYGFNSAAANSTVQNDAVGFFCGRLCGAE